jgi:DNA gyrase/topoisomerase IV subunit B
MQPSVEKLSTTNITDIMQTACIDYSMSVIISRALPGALFTLLMGDDVPPGRQFIEDNALNVQYLDV